MLCLACLCIVRNTLDAKFTMPSPIPDMGYLKRETKVAEKNYLEVYLYTESYLNSFCYWKLEKKNRNNTDKDMLYSHVHSFFSRE